MVFTPKKVKIKTTFLIPIKYDAYIMYIYIYVYAFLRLKIYKIPFVLSFAAAHACVCVKNCQLVSHISMATTIIGTRIKM